MKSKILVILLIILVNVTFSQSIWFNQPIDGAAVTSDFNFSYGSTNSNDPNIVDTWVVLETDNGSYNTKNYALPTSFHRNPGTYTWRLKLYETYIGLGSHKVAEASITFYVKHTIYFDNVHTGGKMIIDGIEKDLPTSVLESTTSTINLEAPDQPYGGYDHIWNTNGTNNSDWYRTGSPLYNFLRNYTHTVQSDEDGRLIQAGLRRNCNITTTNLFTGASGGQIKVNGVTYSAPKAEVVVEQNPITVEGFTQTIDDIIYLFQQWSDGITTNPRTIYPSEHQTITAQFLGIPLWSDTDRGLQFNSYSPRFPETHVQLTWNEYPNTNITQYEIWRYEKLGGAQVTSPSLQGTVNRGTTSWTDIDFFIRSTGDGIQLYYDVKAVFAAEGTRSPDNYELCYGVEDLGAAKEVDSANVENELIIKDYSLSNFPNPFNPTTTINYQLPTRGHVTIKVYDMLGKEVAELVNETKEMGIYNAEFSGRGLSSGVYVYTINVDALSENGQNYTASKKMLMMK